jgi:hypothetical protein
VKRGKAEKSNPNKKRFIYTAVVMVVILVPAVLFLQSYFTGQGTPKAAIIDQLGSSKLDEVIRDENQTFLNTVEELVYKRFSVVDFYSDNATVEQYEQLATAGYKLIVWRAHSALAVNSNYVAISTTDKEGSINTDEYLRNGQQTLTLCNITGDPILYYAITPEFIQEVMPGAFHDTVIVLMSCNGLKQGYLRTAQAFQAKGATVVISWDGWVDPSNNDLGGTLLLQRLIDGNDSVTVAINNTSFFSPEFGWASLQYYPQSLKVGNYQIPDYRQDTLHDGLMTSTSFRKTEKPQRESST